MKTADGAVHGSKIRETLITLARIGGRRFGDSSYRRLTHTILRNSLPRLAEHAALFRD
jgi:hypothetical protein